MYAGLISTLVLAQDMFAIVGVIAEGATELFATVTKVVVVQPLPAVTKHEYVPGELNIGVVVLLPLLIPEAGDQE